MIVMAIICFQAPSLASALTGGAAVQQGIQMVQNAMMVAGLRATRAPSPAAGAAGATGGGVIRAGAGLPHAAGVATGRAAVAGARVAGTMATGAGAIARGVYGPPASPPTALPPFEAAPDRKDSHEQSPSARCHRRSPRRSAPGHSPRPGHPGHRRRQPDPDDPAGDERHHQDREPGRSRSEQLQNQVASINGIRNLGNVFNSAGLNNYVPANAYTVVNAVDSSGYGALTSTGQDAARRRHGLQLPRPRRHRADHLPGDARPAVPAKGPAPGRDARGIGSPGPDQLADGADQRDDRPEGGARDPGPHRRRERHARARDVPGADAASAWPTAKSGSRARATANASTRRSTRTGKISDYLR